MVEIAHAPFTSDPETPNVIVVTCHKLANNCCLGGCDTDTPGNPVATGEMIPYSNRHQVTVVGLRSATQTFMVA